MEKHPGFHFSGRAARMLALASLLCFLLSCSLVTPKASPGLPAQAAAATQPPVRPANTLAAPTKVAVNPTSTVVTASQPSDQVVQFNAETASAARPEDVLAQTGYLGAATAFGGWRCGEPSSTLYDLYTSIQGKRVLEPGIPTIFYVCGWKAGEPASLLLRFPGGATLTTPLMPVQEGQDTPGVYYAEYTYTLGDQDPQGEYTFVFKGDQREVAVPAVTRAITSSVLRIAGQQDLYLAGFQPGEGVRLFAYIATPGQGWQGAKFPLATFQAVQAFTVDQHGFLHARTGFDAVLFAALGEHSGEALAVHKEYPVEVSSIRRDSCEYASFASLLGEAPFQAGEKLVVALQDESSGLGLYGSPGGEHQGSLAVGASVAVAGGPRCADGYRWWKVSAGSRQGWVKETGYYYDIYLKRP